VGSPPTEPAVGAAAATGAAEGAVLSDRRPGGLDEPTPSAPDDEAPASASADASQAGAVPDSGEASPGAEQGHGSAAPAVEARARADLKGSAVARAGTTEHATAVAAAELVQDAAAVPMEESAADVVDGDNPVGADATLLKVDEVSCHGGEVVGEAGSLDVSRAKIMSNRPQSWGAARRGERRFLSLELSANGAKPRVLHPRTVQIIFFSVFVSRFLSLPTVSLTDFGAIAAHQDP